MTETPSREILLEQIRDLEKKVSGLEKSCRDRGKSVRLLNAIKQAQSLYIIDADATEIYKSLLQALVEISGSEYGFLDEVLHDDAGNVYKRNLAISNIAWDDESRALYKQLKDRNLKFSYLENLSGLPALTGKTVISNNPSGDKRARGLPKGHPPIHTYIGMPLSFGGKLICVAGLANRENGYDAEIADFLEPLLATCAAITYAIQKRDIETAFKEKLRMSEARYRNIFMNSPLGLFRSTFGGRFMDLNPALARMLGYESPEAVLEGIHDIGEQIYVRTEQRKEIVSQQLQGDHVHHYVNEYRRRDGSVFIANLYLRSVCDSDDKPVFMEGIIEDITERRQAEKDLQESRKRFQTLADFTYDWEYWSAPDGAYLYVSPSCERITGYAAAEFMKDPALMEQIIHPEDLTMVMHHELEACMAYTPHSLDFRIITKAGESRWISHICQPVYDAEADDAYLGRRGSNRDISDQMRLQGDSRKAQQMEAIVTLAGGVAHQFNNALSVITGNMELLSEDLSDSDLVAYYVREMQTATDRMQNLTTQLLAYARGGKYQAKIMALRDFVQETLPILRSSIASDIAIDSALPEKEVTVSIDRTQMQMALAAVLANASEAMDGKGCIRLTCRRVASASEAVLKNAGFPEGDYACLTVSDTGKGMAETVKNRIFEPFFTTKLQGRGLGMAAAYGIAKNHNGLITVSSELGKGTDVLIYLPILEMDRPDGRKTASETGNSRHKGTILVVDDEASVIKVCRSMLERTGYRTLEAESGAEALTMLKTFGHEIDLVLLDVMMPDMKGDALYPLLREQCPELKVVVNSGFSVDGPVRRLLEAGADAFIQKPFSIRALSGVIADVLNIDQR